MVRHSTLIALVILAGAPAWGQPPRYEMIELNAIWNHADSLQIALGELNSDGHLLYTYERQEYIFRHGQRERIFPGSEGLTHELYTINDDGLMAGWSDDSVLIRHPDGALEFVEIGDWARTTALGNGGDVAIRSSEGPMRWFSGEVSALPPLRNAQGIALDTRVEDINTYGDCVGWAYDEEVEQYAAVRWVGDVISRIDLPWEGSALGHELNDAGEVFIATTESLIVWRDGDYRVLEEYAPGRDVPTELTNAGRLVGRTSIDAGPYVMLLWDETGAVYRMDDLLLEPLPDVRISGATDMNDRGEIVGTAVRDFDPDDVEAGEWFPVLLRPVVAVRG